MTEEFQKMLAAVGLTGHRGNCQCHPPQASRSLFLLGSSLLSLVSSTGSSANKELVINNDPANICAFDHSFLSDLLLLLCILLCCSDLLATQLLEVYLLLFYLPEIVFIRKEIIMRLKKPYCLGGGVYIFLLDLVLNYIILK